MNNQSKRKIFAILLASGSGQRLNKSIPKQFIKVKNWPLFYYSLITFLSVKLVDQVVLVVNQTYLNKVINFINKLNLSNKVKVISGGMSRHDSLVNGLKYLKTDLAVNVKDLVLTHDVARPLVSKQIIETNIFKLLNNECDVTSTGIYSCDSVAVVNKTQTLTKIVDRKKIFLEQTPQSSTFSIFEKIYSDLKNNNDLLNKTNDFCELALFFSKKVCVVNGSILNFKITSSQDLLMFKKLLNNK